MIAVSVDPPDVSERLRERLDLPMRFLSDTEGTLFELLNVRDSGGRPPPALVPPASPDAARGRDIFLPATFLVDVPARAESAPVVLWVYRPATYRVRATPDTVIAAIDGVGR